jgi:hypothetical protein
MQKKVRPPRQVRTKGKGAAETKDENRLDADAKSAMAESLRLTPHKLSKDTARV